MLQKEDYNQDTPVIFDNPSTESNLSIQPYIPVEHEESSKNENKSNMDTLLSNRYALLVVDGNVQMRQYIAHIFKSRFTVYEAPNGEKGIQIAKLKMPDLIIIDVQIKGMSGIEMCKRIKEDPNLSYIPVILLTGSKLTVEKKIEGLECGADDFLTKPFEKELLVARVVNILRSRTQLQKYFYNEVTLQNNTLKVSPDYKVFIDKCIAIVELHLDDEHFNIQVMASEMGMSYSNLYKKIKSVSGQSVNAFIRFIRLRKAAEMFINSHYNVNEVAFKVGIKDLKYFRQKFYVLFGMKPSDYIKKYRMTLGESFNLYDDVLPFKLDVLHVSEN